MSRPQRSQQGATRGGAPSAPLVLLAMLAGLSSAACRPQSPGTTVTDTRADTVAKSKAQEAAPALTRPQLMLVVVIDQLGSATYKKLEPLLSPEGALRSIAARGALFESVEYDYAATYTAPGHAAIYSGAVPARSGVTSNYWIDRKSGRSRSVVDDGEHPIIGKPDAHAGPDALRVETIADVLKRTTEGASKVVSLSLKDRAAVIPGGKRADLVLWLEPSVGGFTSSTQYVTALPTWLEQHQHEVPLPGKDVTWAPAEPERLLALLGPDAAPGEGDYQGAGVHFPHQLGHGAGALKRWRMFPESSEYLVELALTAATAMELGADDVPDLLAISLSGTDYAGHVFGPDSWEYADHLRRADLALARLIDTLAARTRLSVLITSDHGVAPLPERQPPASGLPHRLDDRVLEAAAQQAISLLVGQGDWVAGFSAPYLFLSDAALKHEQAGAIRARAADALAALPGVRAAYDTAALPAGALGEMERRVRHSVHPDSSGEVFVVTLPHVIPDVGITPGAGTTHGSPWDYDRHVPVWVLAPGVHGGRQPGPLPQAHVAPTIAALLGIPAPASATAGPLPGMPR